MLRLFMVIACSATLVVPAMLAQDSPKAEDDPIETALEKAKRDYRSDIEKAAGPLLVSFADEEKRLKVDTRLKVEEKILRIDRVQAEKNAFTTTGKPPTSPNFKTATTQYQAKVLVAKSKCEYTLDVAAGKYLQVDLAKAKAVVSEKKRFFQQDNARQPDDRWKTGVAAGQVQLVKLGNIEVALRWCPPGKFTMGSPPGEKGRDKNEEQVEVEHTKGFWLFQTEVTQEFYEAVIGKNPSHFKGPKNPVDQVSYAEAVEFADALTRRLCKCGALAQDWELRLPTEAQWEYAARAGTKRAFPFGKSLGSEQANFNGNFPYGDAAKSPRRFGDGGPV